MKTVNRISLSILWAIATMAVATKCLSMVSAKNDIEMYIGLLCLMAYLYLTAVAVIKSIKNHKKNNEKSIN